MKKMFFLSLLFLVGCGKEFVTVETQTTGVPPQAPSMAVPNITINIEGDQIDNSNNNSNTSNGGSATGGSNSNSISSGNSSATGTGGAGGTGGSASAGNSTSTANNSSSSNSTNTSTNSGSASNQANNSTNNSSDNSATGGYSQNDNTNTQNQTNNQDQENEQDQEVGDIEAEVELGVKSGKYCENKKSSKGKKNNGKKKMVDGLKCSVYDLISTKPSYLPDFNVLSPVAEIEVDKLDVVKQNYSAGFPKFPNPLRTQLLEWYGVRCTGYLRIDKKDFYTFFLTSDDGARMYLDNTLFLDNDGLHPTQTKQNSVYLKKGNTPIVIDYFQGPRVEISLVLEMQSSSVSRQVVPSNKLGFKK